MKTIEIYDMLLELIDQKAASSHIDKNELEKYYVPEGRLLKQNYLQRLASSLQNSGMMHNSIRFNESEERFSHIKKVLFEFDYERASKEYQTWEELYNALTVNGKIDNGVQKNDAEKRTNWGKYAKGLFAGITFLNNEGGSTFIKELCDYPSNESELKEKIKAIKTIEKRIHGLGFALTCDWLKECGCTWLAKPDIHIKVVCAAIAGKDVEKLSDKEVIEMMYKMSEEIKQEGKETTPYKLDKIIWLICTGNFYLNKDKIGRDTILSKLKD